MKKLPWRCVQVVSSPPAAKETGAMGREIESHQGICRVVVYLEKMIEKVGLWILCTKSPTHHHPRWVMKRLDVFRRLRSRVVGQHSKKERRRLSISENDFCFFSTVC
jgi:hypothetical protein